MREERNIFLALAQRRQMNLDRVQAEQQIFAEASAGDFGLHVGVGRGKNARIHATRGRRADAFELAGFERAQKLGLEIHRHVGDFVEEQRAAIGQLETARRDPTSHP